jgi:tetratricopeptide (TPR) repeat protein
MRRAFPVFLLLLIACGPFFYQAPPSLGNYPERIAAKRWQHLVAESLPPVPPMPDAAALNEVCRNLPETLAPLDTPKRLAEIDRLLAENRNGPYSVRRANFLHELRELAADTALFDAAESYIAWRVAHDLGGGIARPEKIPWDMPDEDFKVLQQRYEFQLKQRLTFFKEQIAKGPPSMIPYWEVRRGAFRFEIGRSDEAVVDFTSVVEGFPDHPRAEAASLMLARIKIEQARALQRAAPADALHENIAGFEALLDEAESILHNYIADHPKGRFTADAQGWLAATAYDRGWLGLAVKLQLARLDLQPTREVTGNVLRECDRIFEKLLESRDAGGADDYWLDSQGQFDAAAVARHPLVARLFVQHCIDPAAHLSLPMWWDDSESGDRVTIDFLKRRILKPKPFIQIALNTLGAELVKIKSKMDATTLTLLAWAATEDGEHEQALAVLDGIRGQDLTDDTLQVRAITLQRLGRHEDAVAAFDALAKNHPDSPLVHDLPYRRSISLFRTGHAGKAILDVLPMALPAEVHDESDDASDAQAEAAFEPQLHPSSQLLQWLDTLIQFAPLEELESAFATVGTQIKQREVLRDAIRTRAIAAHRFDVAGRYLAEDGNDEGQTENPGDDSLAGEHQMASAGWNTRVLPLADLYSQLEKTTAPVEREQLHLSIARHWMKHRGYLTLPSLALCDFSASEGEKIDQLRRRNALELGFPRDLVHRELDHHDEATHALEHALEAAASKNPAIGAPALELANECLFRRAEFSIYQKSRALETEASRLSADLYRQLRGRFPDSPEARRAVYFTFSPSAGPWMPGDYNSWRSASALIGALFGIDPEDRPEDGNVMEKIGAIPLGFESMSPKKPLAAIRRELATARHELDALRPKTDPDEQDDVLAVITRLDDLYSAASLPGIRTSDFLNYANGKTDDLPPAFKSLLDFRDRLKPITGDDGDIMGLKNDTIDGWRQFLELYRDSPKAEAASFRLTRLIARNHRPPARISAFHFPEAPIPNGYKRVEVRRLNPTLDPAEVLTAINHHEMLYPGGRYQEDLNLLRAGALIDSGEFPLALSLLDSILSNQAQRDLHVLAAIEFADIGQRLLEPDQRELAAKAFRRRPEAINKLRLLVEGDTFLSRLKPLMPWLEGDH